MEATEAEVESVQKKKSSDHSNADLDPDSNSDCGSVFLFTPERKSLVGTYVASGNQA